MRRGGPGCLVHCEPREDKKTSGEREDQTCSGTVNITWYGEGGGGGRNSEYVCILQIIIWC